MKTKTPKKTVRNTENAQNPPHTPTYTLSGCINGSPFILETSDIAKAIKILEPDVVLTESYITLSRGDGPERIVNEQRLNLIMTKRVFRDEISREIFVNNLLIPFN